GSHQGQNQGIGTHQRMDAEAKFLGFGYVFLPRVRNSGTSGLAHNAYSAAFLYPSMKFISIWFSVFMHFFYFQFGNGDFRKDLTDMPAGCSGIFHQEMTDTGQGMEDFPAQAGKGVFGNGYRDKINGGGLHERLN